MQVKSKFQALSIGFAIFSMFFGAGNTIFPLVMGTFAKDKNLFAVLGLSITAIVVPIIGLLAMFLYQGDYKQFFYRMGRWPGFFVILLIMMLIGPFAGTPRCITLSFATVEPFLPKLPFYVYSLISCSIIYLATIKKRKVVDVLGKILTPILLGALAVIIVKGFLGDHVLQPVTHTRKEIFFHGLHLGYQMMDLLASFFFAAVVVSCVKTEDNQLPRTRLMVKSSFVTVALLGIIYAGFSSIAAFNSLSLENVSNDALLGVVGTTILGDSLGFVMCIAVALACLTTAIALVSIFSEYIKTEIFKNKLSYPTCLVLTLLTTFTFSNLGFMGICNMVAPILEVCYPALIVLSLVNIAHKLFDFKPIKTPVYIAFFVSVLLKLISV